MQVGVRRFVLVVALGGAMVALLALDKCCRYRAETVPGDVATGDIIGGKPPSTAEASGELREGQSEPVAAEIPRFAANSPFVRDYNLPGQTEEKRLWATSFLWEPAPEFVVERWLTPEPARQGKFLLIEYWATWCGPCRRSIPVLNEIHHRFADRLAVIGISDESEEAVRALKEPTIAYHLAIDTQARMKKALGVTGIPHAIIVEPGGNVVWEGYPLLEGHELTPDVAERILNAGRVDSGK